MFRNKLIQFCALVSISAYASTAYAAAKYDELNLTEIANAIQLVEEASSNNESSFFGNNNIARATGAQDTAAAEGPSISRVIVDQSQAPLRLMVERRPGKGTNRQANVYYYDYSSDETIHSIVDIATNEVASTDRLKGVQLPLIPKEIDNALELVLNDPKYRALLEEAFEKVTKTKFKGKEQLKYKSFVFHADTSRYGLVDESKECGISRCANLLIYTQDQNALGFSPIVDLSNQRVTQILSGSEAEDSIFLSPNTSRVYSVEN